MLIDAGLPSYDESYVPPEWLSLKLSTTRSDLWQLGALAVHVLCGSPPSKGGVLPRATPEPLQTVVQRLLSMDPAARPPSVRPVLDVLAAIRDADDVEEEVSGLVLVDDVRTATQSTPPPLPVKKAQIVVPEESTDALMVPVGFASVRAAWLEGIRRAWASIQRTWRSLPWASTRWRTTLSLERLRARLR
jgi:serine/threonine protein kinase